MSTGLTPAVSLRGICKTYGTTTALKNVSLDIFSGEVHALLGENGAGKSTLMKTLYGLTQPDDGHIQIEGHTTVVSSPRVARECGIGMVTQHFSLVKTMSVAENLALATSKLVKVDLESARTATKNAAERYGLEVQPDAIVGKLPIALQQRVEILKALAAGCRYLILDEPTAVLGPRDIESLLAVVRKLRDEDGLSVVLISHKMKEIEQVADRVSVLRRGEVVASTVAKGMSSRELITMMVGPGEHDSEPIAASETTPGETALSLRGVSVTQEHGGLDDVSFDIRSGEILGIAGVSGNGQSELVAILSGMGSPDHGTVAIGQTPVEVFSPTLLMAMGVGMLGEDRYSAAVPQLAVAENLVLNQLSDFSRFGLLDRQSIAERCKSVISEFEIKADPGQPLGELSGGNMQKVLLARLFGRAPKVAIVSQPTRGLDFVSTKYVRSLIRGVTKGGAAVLLVSEDLDEVIELSDRVAVMYRGSVIAIVERQDATRERIGELMVGVAS